MSKSDAHNVIKGSSMSSLLSDHHAVLFDLSLQKPALPRKMITSCSYKYVDNGAIQPDIFSSDLLQNPAVTLGYLCNQYDTTLLTVSDKHSPLKTKHITICPFTPWYSDEINDAKKL